MDANVIMVDRVAHVAVANGILRLECVAMSATGQEKPSGTVLISAVVAGQVIQGLVNALQDLDKKVRETSVAGGSGGFPSTIPTGNMTVK